MKRNASSWLGFSAMLDQMRQPVQATAAAFVVAASLLCVAQAKGAESQSQLHSEPEGWVDILPPADLKGWYRVPVPPTGPCQFEDCGREKGCLGMEGEGYRIEFRNLKMKPLR